MLKYIGITVVLFLGIAAIGTTYYQANLLQQELLTSAVRISTIAIPIPAKRAVITSGPFSFMPLVPQMFQSVETSYAVAGDVSGASDLSASASRSGSTILPAPTGNDAWRSFKWIWKQPTYTSTKPATTTTSVATTTKPITATSTKPTVATTTPKTATTTTTIPKTSTTTTSVPKTPTTTSVTPTPTPTPTPAPTPVVSTKLQWGVFAGDQNDNLAAVEKMVGKQANIQAVFAAFDDPFPDYIQGLCPNKTLLVFWENTGFSLDNIIAGKYDASIKNFSAGAQKYGCPVILSLFHEMNGNWDEWDGPVGTNSAAKIISAWKHVHNLVTASNVKWAWAVNNVSVPDTEANEAYHYYPGDAYVDYVGVDGFNLNDPWTSFSDVFDTAISHLQQYNKPIYIFSMGAVANSKKAAWIADGLGVQVKKYKNLAGWVWFNQNGADGNWSFNSDAASLAAFIAALP